jgi:hypothetical protein
MNQKIQTIPDDLHALATLVKGKSLTVAKRLIVAQVGCVARAEKFDDDVVDSVFSRLQHVAQVGRYTDEADLAYRRAKRLDGEGEMTVFRAAPKGAKLRPGDFTTGTRQEAGFYKHGTNVVQKFSSLKQDLLAIEGSVGGGQEYVFLPKGCKPAEVIVHFPTFRAFFECVNPVSLVIAAVNAIANAKDNASAAAIAAKIYVEEHSKPASISLRNPPAP